MCFPHILFFLSLLLILSLFTFDCVGALVLFVLEVWLGVGGGGEWEGMLAREGSRMRWIEETQIKTMVCGVLQGIDRHHILFSSPHFVYGW
jgi:hypothetical protein